MSSKITDAQFKPILVRVLTVTSLMIMALALTLWLGNDLFWLNPWLLTLVSAVIALIGLVVVPKSTIAERGQRKPNTEAWDKVITSMAGILYFAFFVCAGLDHRFRISPKLPYGSQMLALLVYMLGYALVIWAMKANAFFSNEVRIQSDRGQIVCDQGPYRYIRHPGYAGIILYYLAMPIVLGSWLSMVPNLITVFLMIIRTILEEKTLCEKLPGYQDYRGKVKYRLLPYLW